ncbi:hypothetical protein P12x_001516 [Tundrisphaera lichenicola]|uniref:hypothetical protein n=1 Tax=Tundrisphaera lichenicola TaxID=2029860 RepID=UPI003EBAF862
MDRSIRSGLPLLALAVSIAFSGCPAEYEELEQVLTVSGTVTYRDKPVKLGAIHFLPTQFGGIPASGRIVDGEIQEVYSNSPGDGIKPGKYRISISAYNEEFLKTTKARDFQGPEIEDVTKGADILKDSKLIPTRYSNSLESGLIEEISRNHHRLDLKLVD